MRHASSDDAAGQGMFASGQKTALLDDTRGRLAQAAIGVDAALRLSRGFGDRFSRRLGRTAGNLSVGLQLRAVALIPVRVHPGDHGGPCAGGLD
jgi:hypothetical protein